MSYDQIKFYHEHQFPYGCFSNYFGAPVRVFGETFPTGEHAFQSQKPAIREHREIVKRAKLASEAKSLGRKFPMRSDWESVKDDIMYCVVKAKFSQNEDIQRILLSTGTAELTESTKNDSYWADGGDGTGRNMLGKILMRVREELFLEFHAPVPAVAAATPAAPAPATPATPTPAAPTSVEAVAAQLPILGKIKVGRRAYRGRGFTEPPCPPGYTRIVVMIRDDPSRGEYGGLSPYTVTTPDGVIVENFWQFLKVYPRVPKVSVPASTNDPRIVWEYPEEVHIVDGEVTAEWDAWRKKGFASRNYIRFPVGDSPAARAACQFSLSISPDGTIDTHRRLDYVTSRKETYGKVYCENVRRYALFKELQDRLRAGENLLIIEVDGPHMESQRYYRERYGIDVSSGTIDVTVENMRIMINDTKHAFGHGYCLAMELLGIREAVCA
jgi:ribA/ribD-fused uncharacterized protein